MHWTDSPMKSWLTNDILLYRAAKDYMGGYFSCALARRCRLSQATARGAKMQVVASDCARRENVQEKNDIKLIFCHDQVEVSCEKYYNGQ